MKTPPSCMGGFAYVVRPVDPEYAHCAAFELKCRICGADAFRVLGYPIIVPDPSPYYAMEPGTWLWRPPHRLRCCNCNATEQLFDVRKNGYDAILNNVSGYESGDIGEKVVMGIYRICVTFAYNVEDIDLPDLQEHAAEAKVQISDLFDWITIACENVDGGAIFELSYECA